MGTFIRKLIKTDPKIFERLKSDRLSARWKDSLLEVQIREIAHSIRNEFYNPKHNTKRDIANLYKDPVLFDFLPYIRREKLIQAGI